MAAPVFMSYSSHDQDKVLALVAALEQRQTACWISCRDVLPGRNYADEIAVAIQNAPALVLAFSRNANASDDVKREVQLASGYKTLVVPFLLEPVQPSGGFAYELKTRQWIDGYTNRDAGIERLANALRGGTAPVVATHQEPTSSAAGDSATQVAQSRRARSPVLLTVAALAIAAAIAGFWLSTRQSPVPGPSPPVVAPPSPSEPAAPVEPKWADLPPGADFINLTRANVDVFRQPDVNSEVLYPIKPGTRLFLGGDPAPVQIATIGGEIWLRTRTNAGDAYVMRKSLCPTAEREQCAPGALSTSVK